jgi:UPF0755 protein
VNPNQKLQELFSLKNIKVKIIVIFAIIVVLLFGLLSKAPKNFPVGSIVTIEPGQSLLQVSNILENRGVIGSGIVFRNFVILLGGEKKVIAGDYLLDKKQSSFLIALRFVKGDFHLQLVKITIPEGWNVFQISQYLAGKIENFDSKKFLELAKPNEGVLFPDTYFISPISTPETVINTMKANFDARMEKKFKSVPQINIIKMASIIEAEASTSQSRKIVSGILWNRLELKMPLQVDSTFSYINGKSTYELTLNDLKIKSPYNTYINTGLPPTPINNPGLDSINAALNPTKTDYLYFLTGKDGKMYYAKTFDEHLKNKEKYL